METYTLDKFCFITKHLAFDYVLPLSSDVTEDMLDLGLTPATIMFYRMIDKQFVKVPYEDVYKSKKVFMFTYLGAYIKQIIVGFDDDDGYTPEDVIQLTELSGLKDVASGRLSTDNLKNCFG